MSVRRVRLGELVALAGAIGLFVSLGLASYDSPTGALDAWGTFGPALAIMIVGALLAIALVLSILTERSTAIPMAVVVWSTWGGIAALVCAIVRVLERPEHATGVATGGWLGLASAAAILVGSWLSMRDERTGAYEPLDVRPAKVPQAPPSNPAA